MFKKTLIALAAAGASLSVNAATVYVDVADGTALPAGYDLAAGTTGAGDQCVNLGVKLGGSTNDSDDTTGDDTVTFDSAAGIFLTTPTGVNAAAGLAAGHLDADVVLSANDTCLVAAASEVTTDALKHSIEYGAVKSIEITPTIVAGVGGYKDEDTITIEISGAKFDTSKTVAPTITIGNRASSTGDATDISFDILEVTDTQVRFTVQTADALTDYVAGSAMLKLGGLFIDSSELSSAAQVAIASYGTNTSGTKFDASQATVVATLTPQYTSKVSTLLDAKIDVGQDRQTFEFGDTDTLVIETEKNTTGLEIDPKEVTYKITGDFSWVDAKDVDANEDGTLTTSELSAHIVKSAGDTVKSMAVNADRDTLTVVATVVAGVDASTSFTFEVPGFDDGALVNPMISVQDFTASTSVTNTKANVSSSVIANAMTNVYAGQWTLNGSVVVLPYVPFGPNTQPILRHTNVGSRTGDISVRYMVEGEHQEWQPLTAAGTKDATPGVRNILSQVTEALKGEGYDSSAKGFKVALEVVTNVPSNDVFVFSGAKVSAEGQSRINLQATKTNH